MELVLLSGIDSAVLGCDLLKQGKDILFIHFNYRQKAYEGEKESIEYFKEFVKEKFKERKTAFRTVKIANLYMNLDNGYIPFRNMIFISMAANYAYCNLISNIYYGAIEGYCEYTYKDCSPAFVHLMDEILHLQERGICLHAPLLSKDKDDIFKKAYEYGLEIHRFWYCNTPSPTGKFCGKCLDCKTFTMQGAHLFYILYKDKFFYHEFKITYFKEYLVRVFPPALDILVLDSKGVSEKGLYKISEKFKIYDFQVIKFSFMKVDEDVYNTIYNSVYPYLDCCDFPVPIITLDVSDVSSYKFFFKDIFIETLKNKFKRTRFLDIHFKLKSKNYVEYLFGLISSLIKHNFDGKITIYVDNLKDLEGVLNIFKYSTSNYKDMEFKLIINIPEKDFIKKCNDTEILKLLNHVEYGYFHCRIIATPFIEYLFAELNEHFGEVGEIVQTLSKELVRFKNYGGIVDISEFEHYPYSISLVMNDYVPNYESVKVPYEHVISPDYDLNYKLMSWKFKFCESDFLKESIIKENLCLRDYNHTQILV